MTRINNAARKYSKPICTILAISAAPPITRTTNSPPEGMLAVDIITLPKLADCPSVAASMSHVEKASAAATPTVIAVVPAPETMSVVMTPRPSRCSSSLLRVTSICIPHAIMLATSTVVTTNCMCCCMNSIGLPLPTSMPTVPFVQKLPNVIMTLPSDSFNASTQ